MKNPEFNSTQRFDMINTGIEQPTDTFRHVSKILEREPALRTELIEKSQQLSAYLLGSEKTFSTSYQILTDFIEAYKINLHREWENRDTSKDERAAEVDALISQL